MSDRLNDDPRAPILVSACLAGRACAYDGNHRASCSPMTHGSGHDPEPVQMVARLERIEGEFKGLHYLVVPVISLPRRVQQSP